MKKIDIREIYVGEILKQTEVKKITDNNIVFGHDPYYVWDYEDESQLGLFVRALGGYKHILTDTIYHKPSKRTGNQHVINPDNIEEIVKSHRNLSIHLINTYNSYRMYFQTLKALEERINEDKEYFDEEDQM